MFVLRFCFTNKPKQERKNERKLFSDYCILHTCFCLLFSFCGFSVFNNAHHIAINTCNNIYISLCVVNVVTAASVVAVAVAIDIAISIKFDVFNIFVYAGFSFYFILNYFISLIHLI